MQTDWIMILRNVLLLGPQNQNKLNSDVYALISIKEFLIAVGLYDIKKLKDAVNPFITVIKLRF